ncbi:MAG: V-type ATP synthase subunit A, partial [Candidatus Omnitrophica bacterium]|nr:V-type ATP synthase subunit A [Candidatus Omnitrophota bacterium]
MATKGKVIGVVSNLVTIEVQGPVSQNEICYIIKDDVRLKAEVIKIHQDRVFAQVFETTRGLKMDTPVEFTEHMLEVELGPGLLSKNYDGLQNDLNAMSGLFLIAGEETVPLATQAQWDFAPLVKPGDTVVAGAWLAEVQENWLKHKIMVPFKLEGNWQVESIVPGGRYRLRDKIAVLKNAQGLIEEVTMSQRWPVKVPIRAYAHKPVAYQVLGTGVRLIDTV